MGLLPLRNWEPKKSSSCQCLATYSGTKGMVRHQHPLTHSPGTSCEALNDARGRAGNNTQGTHQCPCPVSGRRWCASHPGCSRSYVSVGTLTESGRPLYRAEGGPQHTSCLVWPLSLPSPTFSMASGHCLLEDEETSEVGGPDAGELDVGVQLKDRVHAEATGPALGEVLPPEWGGKWEQTSAPLLTSPPEQRRSCCPHVPAVTGKPPAVLPAPDDDVP